MDPRIARMPAQVRGILTFARIHAEVRGILTIARNRVASPGLLGRLEGPMVLELGGRPVAIRGLPLPCLAKTPAAAPASPTSPPRPAKPPGALAPRPFAVA